MKVTATTKRGGAVQFNGRHGAWASYHVAGVGKDTVPTMYAGLTLTDGRGVQLFVNRASGLIVVDVIDKGGKGGREILRRTV